MKLAVLAAVAATALGATPALAQGMDASMPGMDMSAPAQAPADSGEPAAAKPDAGQASPPPAPTDHAADRVFDPAAMAAARAQLGREHGGGLYSTALVNLAEYQAGGGYRWDGEASFGGDLDRFVVKSEGDGGRRDGVGAAEVQALYARAISPYFNLQAGVRYDFSPTPNRAYATLGFEGLAPYWFEVAGALFLSDRGELLGRLEGDCDQRITQRLILQPRVEANFAAQNARETGIGSGVSNLELGLRLRYEVRREFAPYIGVSFDRKLGATADYARARGELPGAVSFVVGVQVRL